MFSMVETVIILIKLAYFQADATTLVSFKPTTLKLPEAHVQVSLHHLLT